MANPKYSIYDGLNNILPGPVFRGEFLTNSQSEYEDIIWLDSREKPTWDEVDSSALHMLRNAIADKINQVTSSIICYGFVYSKAPETKIWSTQEWQFDVMNLVNARNMLSYPYQLKASEKSDATTVYIEMADADTLYGMYLEFFNFVATKLKEGRTIKDSLNTMTRKELENFTDSRELLSCSFD